ncbi:hypothetical protein ACQP1V_42965 (plasmid) [Microtetraspora malaysiensis]|uniref:hypothetical protein n=1 Tax=Microtetraspora malaysiensis TaxID=161358 RepID=UPI003D89B17D
MSPTVTGLLITTDVDPGHRVVLLTEGGELDRPYLSGCLTVGDGDSDAEVVDVEDFPEHHLLVARLAYPGDRPRNTVAAALLDQHMTPAANRWWLDLRGAVVLVGLSDDGAPADVPGSVLDAAERVSDAVHSEGRNAR